jgi:hypothetical protein
MAVATRDRFSREEQVIADQLVSLMQTDGKSGSMAVDRDYLLEDGNTDLFFLHYFPRDFLTFEPVNYSLLDMLENDRQTCAWLPAQHGKTTTVRHWLIYVMCREPQISTVYIEKNETTARGAARAIAAILETNDNLIHDYGEFKSGQWSTEAIIIRQRPETCQWPTIAFYGAGGSAALGKRANICIVDDPVTSDNSSNEGDRQRLYDWYGEQPATIPTPLPIKRQQYLSKIFLIGTTFHMDDLFHRVLAKGGYKHLYLKAVDENGECLAPNRFCWRDTEALKRSADDNPADARLLQRIAQGHVTNLWQWKKDNSTGAFLKRYQNQIVDKDTQKFPREWFDGGADDDELAPPGGYPGCLDEEHELGEERKDGWVYVTGVDPASGTGGSNTVRFSCVTLGCDMKNDPNLIYLVELDYGQQPMVSDNPGRESQVDIVLRHVKRYGSRVVLERNNVQGVWAQAIQQEARRRGMIVNISGHFTTDVKRIDPNLGIEAMAPMVENGFFRVPVKRPSDRRKTEDLIEEFVYWGVFATDDILMGTWFAWRVLEKAKRSHVVTPLEPREIKPYMNRGDEWNMPPSWTKEQRADFMREQMGLKDPQEAGDA